jgi:pilus assembly protein CpaE
MKNFTLAIIDKDEDIIQNLVATFKNSMNMNSAKVSNNIDDLEILLDKKTPTIALIGPSFELSDFENIVSSQQGSLNHVKIVLLTKDLSADLLQKALKLDIHDVLEFPLKITDFIESIERAKNIFDIEPTVPGGKKSDSKKILFLSTKGGSGNTFLATNFSIALKKATKKEVVLYDLNYQLGDDALVLGIYPKHTIFDLVSVNKYDPETLDVFLSKHESGIKLLPSPIDPSQGEAIDTEKSVKILQALDRLADYTVIDAPFGLSDLSLSFLEYTDQLFMVSTKDLLSIKNLKIYLQVLKKLNFDDKKIFIVLNRADSKVEFEKEEIEKAINRKVDLCIPSDKVVPISINKGSPPVIKYPRSAVSKSISRLVSSTLRERVKARV